MLTGRGQRTAAASGRIAAELLGSGGWNGGATSAPEHQPSASRAAARRTEAQIRRADPPLPPPDGAVSEVRCSIRLMHGGPGGPYYECHADVTVDGLTT